MITALAVALLLLVLLWRRPSLTWVPAVERALGSRRAPLVAGAICAGAAWYVLGSLSPTPVIHDEAAYLLQAQIFAGFRWAAPPRPFPEFFEQFHTLVTPATAAKYPPAFGIVLVPGVWLGMPALMLVVLDGLAGGMLFALARRFGNAWVALLATAFWLVAPISGFRAGYFSEVLTGAIWLAGWMALLRWRDGGGRRWLVALSVLVAFGALARPLTMVAYALATGAATIWLVARRRAWADLAVAALAGVLVLGIGPLWSARTTGSWRTTPLAVYTQQYLPYDKPGFAVDRTPPERAGGADMQEIYRQFLMEHEQHARTGIVKLYASRLHELARSNFGQATWPLLAAAAVVGLVGAGGEVLVATGAAAALVLLYGAYAHPNGWTLYYVEAAPVLAFLAAAGCWRVVRLARTFGGREVTAAAGGEQMLFLSVVTALLAAITTQRAHVGRASAGAAQTAFFAAVRALPQRSVVFVRYGPRHNAHESLVANEPDLATTHAWIVHDRGPENARLMALAPDRAAYGFDEASRTLFRLGPADLAR